MTSTYILFNVVQASIIWDKSSNLLPIFDELNPGTLSNSGVGLFSLNTSAYNKKHFHINIICSLLNQDMQIKLIESYIFSRTIPFAWEEPAKGFFHSFPRWDFLYDLSAHLCLLRWDLSLRAAPIPRVFL